MIHSCGTNVGGRTLKDHFPWGMESSLQLQGPSLLCIRLQRNHKGFCKHFLLPLPDFKQIQLHPPLSNGEVREANSKTQADNKGHDFTQTVLGPKYDGAQ